MNRIHILLYTISACMLFACGKENVTPSLPAGTVSIQGLTVKDTLVKEVAITRDTAIIIGLKAVLDGQSSTIDHIVTFRPDTTRMTAYRTRYGNATLLPYGSYVFFRSQCRIPAGASVSDSIQVNLTGQTKLKAETVYVLPVIIQHVDGTANAVAPGQVLYIVTKTGKSPSIKTGWSIVSASSVNSASNAAEFVLDEDLNTAWASAFAPMPQHLVIDFGKQLTFNGVSYFSVPASSFSYGGYPTKVKIEVSTNGTAWIDKGTYNGATTAVTWKQSIGLTTARYLRFTVLEAAPYILGLEVVQIGDISIIP